MRIVPGSVLATMRLRSTQFVFFVLLLCVAQAPADVLLPWMAGAIAEAPRSTASSESTSPWKKGKAAAAQQLASAGSLTPLPSAGRRAWANAWPMHAPARSAAAINVHTGLLRA